MCSQRSWHLHHRWRRAFPNRPKALKEDEQIRRYLLRTSYRRDCNSYLTVSKEIKQDASLIRFVDPGLVDTGADVTVIRDLEWPDRCGFQLVDSIS
ncbi:unnamed protein product [Caretta caretta]